MLLEGLICWGVIGLMFLGASWELKRRTRKAVAAQREAEDRLARSGYYDD